MNIAKKYFVLVLLCLQGIIPAKAQVYPVQSQLFISPPYSVFLSDFVSPEREILSGTVLLNDPMQASLEVYLQVAIMGQGISIISNPTYRPAPILLSGAVPYMLGSTDLAPYFNPNNLIFQGIDEALFRRTGRLPEGVYRFEITVFEYRRGVRLSNKATATAWLVLNEPPRWTIPVHNSVLKIQDPQYLFFSWIPMHKGSPNAAFSTEYEFTLVELLGDHQNPDEAIMLNRPLYQTTTDMSSLVFGPAEPALIAGKRYACRLRAYDTGGRDMFKNEGKSTVLAFTYGQECPIPLNFRCTPTVPYHALAQWDGAQNHTSYTLEFKPENRTEFYGMSSSYSRDTIKKLLAETQYTVRLKGLCGNQSGAYTEELVFKTPALQPISNTCGQKSSYVVTDRTSRLENLAVGDKVMVAGFEAEITEVVKNADGSFSGKSVVNSSNFGVKVRCTFENVQFNDSKQLIAGSMKSVYDPRYLMDGDKVVETVQQSAKLVSDMAEYLTKTDPTVAGFLLENVNNLSLEQQAALKKIDEGKKLIAQGEALQKEAMKKEPPDETDLEIAASMIERGNLMVSEGTQNLKEDAGLKKVNRIDRELVEFEKSASSLYGLDKKNEPALTGQFECYVQDGKQICFDWKALSTARGDELKAIIPFKPEGKIVFKYANEKILPYQTKDNKEYIVQVQGAMEGDGNITAYIENKDKNEESIGRINTITYTPKSRKLLIVSESNSTGLPSPQVIAQELNKIYSQSVLDWQVEQQSIAGLYGGISEINDCKSGILSSYSGQMKEVIAAYEKTKGETPEGTVVLFVMQGNTCGMEAYMPLQQQYGFLFTQQIGTQPEKQHYVIAHELGHALGLYHTFSSYNEYFQAKGSTNNIMDYPSTTSTLTLNKYQWDAIHDPKMQMGWFEGDEEGAIMNRTIPDCIKGHSLDYQDGDELLWKNIGGNKIQLVTPDLFEGIKNSEDWYSYLSQFYSFFKYQVKIGDNLENISFRYGISKNEILRYNSQLRKSGISNGMIISIPPPESAIKELLTVNYINCYSKLHEMRMLKCNFRFILMESMKNNLELLNIVEEKNYRILTHQMDIAFSICPYTGPIKAAIELRLGKNIVYYIMYEVQKGQEIDKLSNTDKFQNVVDLFIPGLKIANNTTDFIKLSTKELVLLEVTGNVNTMINVIRSSYDTSKKIRNEK